MEKNKIIIEISISENDSEELIPEHYGYYNNIDEAIDELLRLKIKLYGGI